MDERTDAWMDGVLGRSEDGWKDGWMGRWMDGGLLGGQGVGGWMDGQCWVDQGMDGCVRCSRGGWIDRQMDRRCVG